MRRLTAASLGLVLLATCRPVHGQESKVKGEEAEHAAALTAARDKGLDWLAKRATIRTIGLIGIDIAALHAEAQRRLGNERCRRRFDPRQENP